MKAEVWLDAYYVLTRHGRCVALLHYKGREKLDGMRL
jgi:hypothetical protein